MNCIIIDDDSLIQKVLKSFIERSKLANCLAVFDNALEAKDFVQEKQIDLIFLDIEMPGMSGFDYLDENETNSQIIIVSGDKKYALDSFSYDVSDYLLKPVKYDRFIIAMNKCISKYIEIYREDYNREQIFIHNGKEFERIELKKISIIEIGEDSVNIETIDNQVTNGLLNQSEPIITRDLFVRINSTVVINVNHILDIKDDQVILKMNESEKVLCIENEFKANVLQRFNSIN